MTPDTPDTPQAVRDHNAKRGEAYKARLAAAAASVAADGPKASTDAPQPKRRQRLNTGSPEGDSAGRWATLNAFVDASMVGLTRVESLAWFILFRDARNGTVCTGMSDIARRAGCSKRAVVDAVGSLVDKGLLRVVRKGRKNSGPSRYTIHAEQRSKG